MEAFGQRLGAHFHVKTAPTVLLGTQQRISFAATRLTGSIPAGTRTAAIPAEEAFSVMLQLRAIESHKLWLGNREAYSGPYLPGSVSVVDFEDNPTACPSGPYDSLHFYIPRETLDELASEHGGRRIAGLSWPRATYDPVAATLGNRLLPYLAGGQQKTFLMATHVALELLLHFAHTYGGMRRSPAEGGVTLSPWQERRAKELIVANAAVGITIDTLAAQCNLSRGHFIRAFKNSTGFPPHRWLLEYRVQKAKSLLVLTSVPLPQIAIDCGFADQAHLTRTFKSLVGTPPAAWRRQNKF
ncbi:MAG TPA: AraC family transcriptional regulator [Dongiaceae bacterium]|nr:AraC family transcriptional regulator [Dongiaceae bacterium]